MPRNAKLRHITKVPDVRDTKAHGSANAQKQHTSLRRRTMTSCGSQETQPEGTTKISSLHISQSCGNHAAKHAEQAKKKEDDAYDLRTISDNAKTTNANMI